MSSQTRADGVVDEAVEVTYREAIRLAFDDELASDPSVVLLGEDIAAAGGPFKTTEGLYEKYGGDRVIDTPIAENGFCGMALGMAMTGMRPVVEILFIDFTMLIMDQLVNQAAKYRLMPGGQGRVPLVLRTQGGVGDGVVAQHSQSLEALFYHVPGLKVVMPSTPVDAKGLLKSAIRDDDPVIFIEHKLLYMNEGPVPEEEYVIEFGIGDIKRTGKDVTLIAWGGMVPKALAVADSLAREDIDVEVIDPRTLVPLDLDLLIESVKKTEHVVIAQEAVRRGGVASDLASIIQEEAFDYLDAPIQIVAGKNTPIPYTKRLESSCIPQEEDIAAGVRRAVYAD